ncbi:MAG: hypothetical protein V4649_16025 [Bacteroidota bacterium]
MPAAPFEQIILDIKQMQTDFKQPQCFTKKPFVEYPVDGEPPKLSFEIPQTTTFTTYGYIVKPIPATHFKAFTKAVPENNYFQTVKNMTSQQAIQLFHPNVAEPLYMGQFTPRMTAVSHGAPVNMAGAVGNPLANTLAAAGYGGAAGGGVSYGGPSAGAAASGFHLAPTSSVPTGVLDKYNASSLKAHMQIPEQLTVQAVAPVDTRTNLNANYAIQGLRPLVTKRIAGTGTVTKYVSQPPQAAPRITIIEEYTTASYLGDYGAGRVVKTFTLLPGEETTISVRTYKDKVTTYEKSQNVIDSFSEASATELDTLMQHEQGDIVSTSDTSGGSSSSFSTSTDSKNSTKSFGISGSLNLGFASIGGGYGQSQTQVQNSSNGFNSSTNYNHSAARQSNINALSSAMEKHVQQSNANRLIDVNTSTSDMARSGEEEATVRVLKNVNLNRVLNFTFRQLLQEYTTITYLSNLKFAYSNGYAESYTVVDLNNLVNMLADIIEPANLNSVLCTLLTPYCKVLNYEDEEKQFVSSKEVIYNDCLQIGTCLPVTEKFYRINKLCIDTYDPLSLEFNGVILNVQKQTLRTSSLIGDALLGAGDALDCFNQNAQNAQNQGDYIRNLVGMQSLVDSIQNTANNQVFATKQQAAMQQQQTIMEGVSTGDANSLVAAEHYKKVYGTCCDVPQSCCGGGCGCGCEDEAPVTP